MPTHNLLATSFCSSTFLVGDVERPTTTPRLPGTGELLVGPFRYQLRGIDEQWQQTSKERFEHLWQNDSTIKNSSTRAIDVYSIDPKNFIPIDQRGWSYTFESTYQCNDVCFIGNDSILSFSPSPGHAILMVRSNINELWPRVMENSLRMMMAYDSLHAGGLLLHSGALIFKDMAHIYVGSSGAGKSTLCTRAQRLGIEILSDEMNLIYPTHDEYVAYALPYAGDMGHLGIKKKVSIASIDFLGQAVHETIESRSLAQSAAGLMANAPFINGDPNMTDKLMALTLKITKIFEPQTLMLTKESTPWNRD